MKNFFKKQNNRQHTQRNIRQNSRGFTLVEMMVSVGLFSIVMTISLGVIWSVIDGNKKAQSVNSVVNNLNFAIDSMVRDIKTGYSYKCGSDPFPLFESDNLSCTRISTDSDPARQSIRLISTISGYERKVMYTYEPANGTTPGLIRKNACNDVNCSTVSSGIVTSPEINIQDLKFYVQGQTAGVDQPGVFLIMRGTAQTNPTTVSDFRIQTFISQRILNI